MTKYEESSDNQNSFANVKGQSSFGTSSGSENGKSTTTVMLTSTTTTTTTTTMATLTTAVPALNQSDRSTPNSPLANQHSPSPTFFLPTIPTKPVPTTIADPTIQTPNAVPPTSKTLISGPLTFQTPISQPLTSQTLISGPLTSQTSMSRPLTSQTQISAPLTSQTLTKPSVNPAIEIFPTSENESFDYSSQFFSQLGDVTIEKIQGPILQNFLSCNSQFADVIGYL